MGVEAVLLPVSQPVHGLGAFKAALDGEACQWVQGPGSGAAQERRTEAEGPAELESEGGGEAVEGVGGGAACGYTGAGPGWSSW